MKKGWAALVLAAVMLVTLHAVCDSDWADTDDYVMRNARLLDDIATREGPATEFAEPGTFRKANYRQVGVISRYQDSRDICWFQVELEYRGTQIRVYCGRQVNIDPETVPIDAERRSVLLTGTPSARKGPGPGYPEYTDVRLTAGMTGEMQNIENSYAQFIFDDPDTGMKRLVWVPTAALALREEGYRRAEDGRRPLAHVVWSIQPYAGPGWDYEQYAFAIRSGTVCPLYAIENEFAQLALDPGDGSPARLVWVPLNVIETE